MTTKPPTGPEPTPYVGYELPLSADQSPAAATVVGADAVPVPMLVANVQRFIFLRWLTAALLAALGAVGLGLHAQLERIGLRLHGGGLLATAAVLLAANVAFRLMARDLVQHPTRQFARLSLWLQIGVDLLVLTAVVHRVGSVATFAPFVYLVHILFACIFFTTRRESLAVTGLASVLYIGCVGLEHLGVLAPSSVFVGGRAVAHSAASVGVTVASVGSAIVVFLVMWYLASLLSNMVWEREVELAETNMRLVAAQTEKARHMLRTTHELKAPFAAIHANTQLLLKASYGVIPPEAAEVLRRISARCDRLAHEIQEMLQLANLKSEGETPAPVELDLAEVGRWAAERMASAARERRVTIQEDLRPAMAVTVEDHAKMLLSNLLSNAVIYSHERGVVRLQTRGDGDGTARVLVEDEGIGIPAEKLPRIFDEYYRTDEAVRHNKNSTGLGLTIVRHVAEAHGIQLRVESATGRGTRFLLRFPPAPRS
jgi:signal transduction histidine kinase